MKDTDEKIMIFRSNIIAQADLLKIRDQLNHHPDIIRWNVDLDDCDRVVRIVTKSLTAGEIKALIHTHGYTCADLD